MDTPSSSGLIKSYCKTVLKSFYEREQEKTIIKIQQKNIETNIGLKKLNELALNIQEIENKSMYLKNLPEIHNEFLEDYQKEEKQINIGMSESINECMELTKGQFVVIGALSGVGKSIFAINIFNELSKQNLKTIYFPTEMKAVKIFNRLLSIKSKIPNYLLRKKNKDIETSRISEKIKTLHKDSIMFYDKPSIDIKNIKSSILATKCDVIIIDHLSTIDTYGAENEARAYKNFLKELREIAVEQNILIFGIIHLNRTFNSEGKSEPTMQNIKYSGSFEQEASRILLLWEDKKDNNDNNKDTKTIKLKIAKNRDGFSGRCNLTMKTDTLEICEKTQGDTYEPNL